MLTLADPFMVGEAAGGFGAIVIVGAGLSALWDKIQRKRKAPPEPRLKSTGQPPNRDE